MARLRPILTIGHSRHSLERFIALLEGAGATAVADVRSAPVSRFSPHFNKAALAASLGARDIDYVFLGKELGGRPEQKAMYTQGVADYEKMAASPDFHAGIARLTEEAERSPHGDDVLRGRPPRLPSVSAGRSRFGGQRH